MKGKLPILVVAGIIVACIATVICAVLAYFLFFRNLVPYTVSDNYMSSDHVKNTPTVGAYKMQDSLSSDQLSVGGIYVTVANYYQGIYSKTPITTVGSTTPYINVQVGAADNLKYLSLIDQINSLECVARVTSNAEVGSTVYYKGSCDNKLAYYTYVNKTTNRVIIFSAANVAESELNTFIENYLK